MKLHRWLLRLWNELRFHFMSVEAIDRELIEDVRRLIHDPRVPLEIKRALVKARAALNEQEGGAK